MSGGNAPGMAPTKTAIGDFRFNGVYAKAYRKIENTDNRPVSIFSLPNNQVPINPITIPETKPCPVVMCPAGIGLLLVLSINLSRSTSITSLKQFAAEVTKKPPTIKINQLPQSIPGATPSILT
ncbi:hypothetical protein D9M68_590930 [compost metagenome]